MIAMTKTKYVIKAGTKTVYQQIEQTTEQITEQQYNSTIEAAPFFRRLGGSEYLERDYTCAGYRVTRIISKSPDRQTKIIREFAFDC